MRLQSSLVGYKLDFSDTNNKETANREPKNYFVGLLPVFVNKTQDLWCGQYF